MVSEPKYRPLKVAMVARGSGVPDSAPLHEHGRLVLVPGEGGGPRLTRHLAAQLQRPACVPRHVPARVTCWFMVNTTAVQYKRYDFYLCTQRVHRVLALSAF